MSIISHKLIKLMFKQIRNANLKYNLIENDDEVAVGMSGGKDSSVLLHLLHLLQKYTPLSFNIHPIYIDLGWNNEIDSLKELCLNYNYNLHIELTNIGEVVFDIREEKSPCSLCANLRRGALNNTAKKLGCNKVALGHHLDDVVNTMFMSMLYENRYNIFKPLTYLDRVDITLIRPMVYVEEKSIIKLADYLGIKAIENLCPADGFTKRDEVAELVNLIETNHPGAKKKILSSIENINLQSFWTN